MHIRTVCVASVQTVTKCKQNNLYVHVCMYVYVMYKHIITCAATCTVPYT